MSVVVEAPMVDAALSIAAEQIVEQSAYGALLGRDGNRGPAAAPQNLYLASDRDDLDSGLRNVRELRQPDAELHDHR